MNIYDILTCLKKNLGSSEIFFSFFRVCKGVMYTIYAFHLFS